MTFERQLLQELKRPITWVKVIFGALALWVLACGWLAL